MHALLLIAALAAPAQWTMSSVPPSGTLGAPLILTGDNAGGVGTLRIRPSDEDTQLVLCEASNNAATEMCTSGHHLNSSATQSYGGFGTNLYFDSSSTPQRYWTSAGFGRVWTAASSTASGNEAGLQVYGTGGAEAGRVSLQASAAATSTLFVGVGGTVTTDFRGPITNGGSATCNGANAGAVCVNDPAVFYDASSTYVAYFGSSAANSGTQLWEFTQGTAGQATTLFATGTMAAPTVVAGVGYYGSTYADADYADKAVFSGVGKEIVSNRTDNVAAGSVHSRWIDDSSASATLAGTTLMTLLGDGTLKPTFYGSQTDCTDNAGAASCGAAPTGAVVLDDGSTTVVVSTTAVTANSTIDVNFDPSLGTKLGITCNTTQTFPYVSGRTAATSFTITSADPAGTNKACFSYSIVN